MTHMPTRVRTDHGILKVHLSEDEQVDVDIAADDIFVGAPKCHAATVFGTLYVTRNMDRVSCRRCLKQRTPAILKLLDLFGDMPLRPDAVRSGRERLQQ